MKFGRKKKQQHQSQSSADGAPLALTPSETSAAFASSGKSRPPRSKAPPLPSSGNGPRKTFKYGASLSHNTFDIGGLPVNVFGLHELTPAPARASAPRPPDVAVVLHLHGRGGDADNEERIVRHLWDRIDRDKQRAAHENSGSQKDVLLVSYDARNHGHRTTNDLGQKGWKEGNKLHALDLYAMYTGTARDVTFIIDFLPAYLFPHDERAITNWAVTGKSLGGHSTWQVLADEPRVNVGVPFIGCPDYNRLLAYRTRSNFVANGPPTVPASLKALISQIDPAQRAYSSFNPHENPFWGKKICVCSGAADKLVRWEFSEEFVRGLVVGKPSGSRGEQAGLKVVLEENIGHEVTDTMIEAAGEWIWWWAVQHGT